MVRQLLAHSRCGAVAFVSGLVEAYGLDRVGATLPLHYQWPVQRAVHLIIGSPAAVYSIIWCMGAVGFVAGKGERYRLLIMYFCVRMACVSVFLELKVHYKGDCGACAGRLLGYDFVPGGVVALISCRPDCVAFAGLCGR